ncbi:transmembrane protein [Mycolicibacterium conceptionense]|uniref:Transmembrane protein n=1 Tax=Mycolicibacterium conceptionense TaxID=451644 RepID=A0A0U1DHN9_9MYCO|nr:transmembrane protein [Mycolicibacterium conceptionense]
MAPGWLVALCAAVLVVVAWLPWLTTSVDGGGRANAIGGAVGSIVLPSGFGPGS